MSTPSPAGGRTDDDDVFTLTMMGYGSLGVIASAAGAIALGYWHKALRWLLHHDGLVAGREQPLITLPYSRGAGLDLPRTLLLAAILAVLVALAIHAARRRFAAREDLG